MFLQIFAKVIQLCKLEDSIWVFLTGVKETGTPLPRTVLAKRAGKHVEVLEAACQLALSALQLVGIRQTATNVATKVSAPVQAGAQRIVSFFNALVIELAHKPFDDNKLRCVYLYLIEGLKTPLSVIWSEEQLEVLADWKHSCCMILTAISKSTTLGEAFIKAISNALAEAVAVARKASNQPLANSALCVLLMLAQRDQLLLSAKGLSALLNDWFIDSMRSFSAQYAVHALTERVAMTAVKCITGETPEDKKHPLDAMVLAHHVQALVQLGVLSDACLQDLLCRLFAGHDQADAAAEVVRAVSHWAPSAFDAATQHAFKDGNEELSQFLAETFSSGGHHLMNFSGDSLFVAMTSPVLALRVQGLAKLATITGDGPDMQGLARAALAMVLDFDQELVEHVYQRAVMRFIVTHLPADEVVPALEAAWAHWYGQEEVMLSILKALTDKELLIKIDGPWLHGILLTSLDQSALLSSAQAMLPSILSMKKKTDIVQAVANPIAWTDGLLVAGQGYQRIAAIATARFLLSYSTEEVRARLTDFLVDLVTSSGVVDKEVELLTAFFTSSAVQRGAEEVQQFFIWTASSSLRLLLAMLLSRDSQLLELLGMALGVFPHPGAVLLQLVLDPELGLALEDRLYVQQVAMQAWSVYARCAQGTPQEVQVLLVSTLLCLWGAASSDASLRLLGSALAEVSVSHAAQGAVALPQGTKVTAAVCVAMLKLMLKLELHLQPDAMHTLSSAMAAQAEDMAHFLWGAVTLLRGIRLPDVTCLCLDLLHSLGGGGKQALPAVQYLLADPAHAHNNESVFDKVAKCLCASASTSSEVIPYILTVLTTTGNDRLKSLLCVHMRALALPADAWVMLLPAYLTAGTQQPALRELLLAIPVPAAIPLDVLVKEVDGLTSAEEVAEGAAALSLQHLLLVLEATVPHLLSTVQSVETYRTLLVSLLDLLAVLTKARYGIVLAFDYYKAAVLQYIFRTMTIVQEHAMLPALLTSEEVAPKKGGRTQKAKVPESQVTKYPESRVPADILLVMGCMGELRAVAAQQHCIGIVKVLLLLSPASSGTAIEGLSVLLAGAQLGQHVSKEKFLVSLLDVLLPICTPQGVQQVIQALCVNLTAMLLVTRRALLRTIIKILRHTPRAIAIALHVLLLHAQVHSVGGAESASSEVILSASGVRKEKRRLRASVAEEFLQLAVSLLVSEVPETVCTSLGELLSISQQLIVSTSEGVVDVKLSLSYLRTTPASAEEVQALCLLHQEYVQQVLEAADLHLSLAKQQASSSSSSFLVLADTLLCILADLERAPPSKHFLHLLGSAVSNNLQALQLLLDAPAYLSIFMELLGHELLTVRQKALVVLRERLSRLLANGNCSDAEVALYLDLSVHVRGIILTYSPSVSAPLVQSAILCLDILLQLLGLHPLWAQEVGNTISAFTGMISSMGSSEDGRKVTASLCLCLATGVKVLGASALRLLPAVMQTLLGLLQAEADKEVRTVDLYVQSLLSAVTVILIAVPAFMHPYLPQLLALLPRVEGDQVMQAIGQTIPPRLLLPVLLAQQTEGRGPKAALAQASLGLALAERAERSVVISALPKWTALCMAFMDYRSVEQDSSVEPTAVREMSTSCVVEVCLKLTETELRAFMLTLSQWKGADDLRAVSFYSLTSALLSRLGALFLGSFAAIWEDIPIVLSYTTKGVQKLLAEGGGGKKRKREAAEDSSNRQALDDLLNLASLVLTCISSTEGFINEERYESIAMLLMDFLPLRGAFSSDASYLAYVSSVLSPALCNATGSISNELLWKPVNHSLLMSMRSSSVAVRRASIGLLKDLFVSVGDDYTSLLPECLSFISELLEDDCKDVVADTRRAITAIEELTGEKLDDYLSA